MDDRERTQTLIQCNRMLLEEAQEERARTCKALTEARYVHNMVALYRAERERRKGQGE